MIATAGAGSNLDWGVIANEVALTAGRRIATPGRRANVPETVIAPGDLVQMLKVAPYSSNFVNDLLLRYDPISRSTAAAYVSRLADSGISKVLVQYEPSAANLPLNEKLTEYAGIVSHLKLRNPQAEVIVDPIALCLHDDLRWGVLRSVSGNIDGLKTLRVVEGAADRFANAGADGYLTLGRVQYEALVASHALAEIGSDARVFSFSTNSETAFAYFSSVADDPDRAETGQKLLVGNDYEMTARALLDAYEGTAVFLQKPLENYAIPKQLRRMQLNRAEFDDIVSGGRVRDYLDRYRDPRVGAGPVDLNVLYSRLHALQLGAYEVSGSTILQRLTQDRYTDCLANRLQHERYLMAQAAAGNSMRYIVGRRMEPYAAYLRSPA